MGRFHHPVESAKRCRSLAGRARSRSRNDHAFRLPTAVRVAHGLGGESVDPFDATAAKSVPGTGAKNRATPSIRAKAQIGKLLPIHLCEFVEECAVERN